MRVGVIFPQTEYGNDPGLIRDFGQTAEALGYAHILVFDHVLGAVHEGREPPLPGPYNEKTPFHEPFVLLGYLAAATTSIELATGVLILPQRQTALVAKQAAEVDILSGGRLRLGVGSGWNHVEYEALGQDFTNRGRRMTEQIEVLRLLWEQDLVDYRGKWHSIDRANILPRPARRIPIWFGGATDPAYGRAARFGDGFMFSRLSGRAKEATGRIREFLRQEGRKADEFGFDAFVNLSAGPDAWQTEMDDWRKAGGTHLSLRTMDAGLEGPEAHLRAIREYAEALAIHA